MLQVTNDCILNLYRQNSDLDFAYRTTNQPLQQNRKSHWPRGKVLGGCSSINFMLAVRGDARGYDKWANEMGCLGWAFKDLEKYFVRLEDYRGQEDSKCRGRHGPVTVSDSRDIEFVTKPCVSAFVEACNELGIPRIADYNAPYLSASAGLSQYTIRNGKRCDAATAYLYGENGAFFTCPNISCITHEQCARVLFDTTSTDKLPRACGVELISGLKVRARMEVILSAGAVGTPQILMLSGVGPKSHLESKGIHVVADLPGVGQNMKDHLMVANSYEAKPGCTSVFAPRNPFQLASALARYLVFGDGIFVSVDAVTQRTTQLTTD